MRIAYSDDPWSHSLAMGLAVFATVAIFRIVRLQYGPALAAQPKVDRGPSRIAMLGISGLVLLALGGIIIGLRNQPVGEDPLLLQFVLVVMIGGCGLAFGAGGYCRQRSWREQYVPRSEVAGGRHYIARELLLTVCPWLTLGLLGVAVAMFLPKLDEIIVLVLFLAGFGTWIFIFQVSPHHLARAEGSVIFEMPSTIAMLRDSLVAFAAIWFLITADEWGFGDWRGRLIVILPPILGVCGALAAKVYELDSMRREDLS